MKQGIPAWVLGGGLERQRTSRPQGEERRLVSAARTALIDLPLSAIAPSRVRHPLTHSRSHSQLTAPQTPRPEPRLRGQSAHILYARHCGPCQSWGGNQLPKVPRETLTGPAHPLPTLCLSHNIQRTQGIQLAPTPLPALFPYPHPLKNLQ